jgi:hypothetical protein
MTATYTFDVFSSLDGFGAASGNWTGYSEVAVTLRRDSCPDLHAR